MGNLKLSHKGYLLVLVPLALELVFIVLLNILVDRSQQEISAQMRAKTISAKSVSLQHQFSECALQLGTTPDHIPFATLKEQVGVITHSIEADLESLTNLTDTTDPLESERIRRVYILGKEELEIVRTALDGGAGGLVDSLHSTAGKRAKALLSSLLRELDDLTQLEAEKSRTDSIDRARRLINGIVCFGVGLNVAMALLATTIFHNHILRRVRHIKENTALMAQRRALMPPLMGSDELADLDKTFAETAAKLQESERLRQEFTAMVSHDLRTPLSSIQAVLDLVEGGCYGAIPDKAGEQLRTANKSLTYLISMINNLLDSEKLEAGKMLFDVRSCSMEAIIQSSVESVEAFAASRGVRIHCQDLTEDIDVSVDPDRIVQLLVNLLSNAIKYSPRGEQVEISLDLLEIDEQACAEVRVIDHGTGIPEEMKSVVFERFRQVQASDAKQRGGYGLGLAICKTLVEQHGGSIGVESGLGRGSTFWFRLPVDSDWLQSHRGQIELDSPGTLK